MSAMHWKLWTQYCLYIYTVGSVTGMQIKNLNMFHTTGRPLESRVGF